MFLCVCKNYIKFSTLCTSSTENGSSFEVFDTATMEIIGFTSETILCINNANSLKPYFFWDHETFTLYWILFCAGAKINPVL